MELFSHNYLLVLAIVFISMSLHELMHAVASYWLGDDTAKRMGRITLNPLKSVDPILTLALPLLLAYSGSSVIFGAAKPVQVNFARLKWGEFGGAIVGIAGPLTNLGIALFFSLVIHLFNGLSPDATAVVITIISVNIGFFVFNLIPWPPLDGSRVLYAFAPPFLQDLMLEIERNFIVSLIAIWLVLAGFGWEPLSRLIISLTRILGS